MIQADYLSYKLKCLQFQIFTRRAEIRNDHSYLKSASCMAGFYNKTFVVTNGLALSMPPPLCKLVVMSCNKIVTVLLQKNKHLADLIIPIVN